MKNAGIWAVALSGFIINQRILNPDSIPLTVG
jgi:hypothetical protein